MVSGRTRIALLHILAMPHCLRKEHSSRRCGEKTRWGLARTKSPDFTNIDSKKKKKHPKTKKQTNKKLLVSKGCGGRGM